MNVEAIRDFCLAKKAVRESFPFDENTLVFKVGNKMFALVSLDTVPLRINLKCNPEKAVWLREKYSAIQPGFHMNKKHWNTILIDQSLPKDMIVQMINDSYELVIKGMSKKEKEKYEL